MSYRGVSRRTSASEKTQHRAGRKDLVGHGARTRRCSRWACSSSPAISGRAAPARTSGRLRDSPPPPPPPPRGAAFTPAPPPATPTALRSVRASSARAASITLPDGRPVRRRRSTRAPRPRRNAGASSRRSTGRAPSAAARAGSGRAYVRDAASASLCATAGLPAARLPCSSSHPPRSAVRARVALARVARRRVRRAACDLYPDCDLHGTLPPGAAGVLCACRWSHRRATAAWRCCWSRPSRASAFSAIDVGLVVRAAASRARPQGAGAGGAALRERPCRLLAAARRVGLQPPPAPAARAVVRARAPRPSPAASSSALPSALPTGARSAHPRAAPLRRARPRWSSAFACGAWPCCAAFSRSVDVEASAAETLLSGTRARGCMRKACVA